MGQGYAQQNSPLAFLCACRDFYPQNDAMRYAREALRAGKSAQDVADNLVDRSLKRYTSDNVSVIVVKFPWGVSKVSKATKGKKFMGMF